MAPSNTLELVEGAAIRLSHLKDPRLDAEILFRGVCGLSRAEFLSRAREPVPKDEAQRFEAAVLRRILHEPIQYILGSVAFWRDEFVVSPAVLIPRPDTEILVEAVAQRLCNHPRPMILDLGTGSGCVGLSLLRELKEARVVAVDISRNALEVAKENAHRLGLEARVDLRVSNWLDAVGPAEAFDAIVSNPPYVSRGDETHLERQVSEFEPRQALFAEATDELCSYRAIIAGLGTEGRAGCRGRLRPDGILAFEVGRGQAEHVAALMGAAGLVSPEILNDLAGIARVVVGRRP